MVCPKCGKEIDNNLKFCESCGEVVTVAPIAKKKKIGKKFIIIIVAIVIVAFFAVFWGLDEGGANDNPLVGENAGANVNNLVIQTGKDDIFGGVVFNLTVDEFVQAYNKQVDEDSDTSVEAELDYLYKEKFSESFEDGHLVYKYSSFNYLRPNDEYGILLIAVDTESQKIQFLQYICAVGTSAYYSFEIPARIFSVVDTEVEYPFKGDYSSYEKRFEDVLDFYGKSETKVFFDNNISYTLPGVGSDDLISVAIIACAKESEFVKGN